MSGNHPSASEGGARGRNTRRLWISFALIGGFMVVQAAAGLITGSLALLSDAGHMATDALGLAMALAAITAANKVKQAPNRTFKLYRLEILAALANAVLLFAVAGYVLIEAVGRLDAPPEVAPIPVLIVGAFGLAANVVAFLLLREGADESLNVRGAYLEVVADMLGSIGVIVAAILIWITHWGWVDPVIGAGIGLFILPRAWQLGREAIRILVQAAPPDTDLDAIRTALAGIDGVTAVRDLHLWTLTSDMDVLTAHLSVADPAQGVEVVERARAMLRQRFKLEHATLEVERAGGGEPRPIGW